MPFPRCEISIEPRCMRWWLECLGRAAGCVAAVSGLAVAQQPVPVVSAAAPAITLDDAITRARGNEPAFAAAVAASKNAALDRSIAQSTLLPSVIYHNQYL